MLRLRRGLTIANKSSESNRIRNIESSNSKLFDCIRTIPQIRRKPKHELNGERIQRILELLKFFCVENRRNRYPGADPGFFLGGGALVSCSTSTPINHIVFLQNTSCIRKPQVISGGGGGGGGGGGAPRPPPPPPPRAPPAPSP